MSEISLACVAMFSFVIIRIGVNLLVEKNEGSVCIMNIENKQQAIEHFRDHTSLSIQCKKNM